MTTITSVMMPVYNAEGFIAEAINSLLAQTYPDWELVVVDDGSTDRSRQIAESFGDERIRVFSQANAGEAAARNLALVKMKGERVAFLDADDAYLPDHLALTNAYLDQNPDKDGVYTDGYHIDSQGVQLQPLSSRRRGPFTGSLFEPLVTASDVFGPPLCVLLRREIIERHNLSFDPEIVIGPDWDFFTHFAQYAEFGYIDQKTCKYRIHTTNISVQTGLKRRAGYLARCREKAILLPGFDQCSVQARTAVFYDLLVNLIACQPDRQSEMIKLPQFGRLPRAEQARLLQYVAADGIVDNSPDPVYGEWLGRAVELDPRNRKARVLLWLYRMSPSSMRLAFRLRRRGKPPIRVPAPFSDLKPS